MELRVLQYFMAVAREESISRAAETLHVTQPTLSRQLAQMEGELGVKLFHRGTRKITLTEEGLLLRRRAEEILELVDKTEEEVTHAVGALEGTVTVGCGDLAGVQKLPPLFRAFQERYPAVTFDLYTGTADQVKDKLDRGLADVGLLLEPVDMGRYDFIRFREKEQWVVAMRPAAPPVRAERARALVRPAVSAAARGVYGQSAVQQLRHGPSRSGVCAYHQGLHPLLGPVGHHLAASVSGSHRHLRARLATAPAPLPGGGKICGVCPGASGDISMRRRHGGAMLSGN